MKSPTELASHPGGVRHGYLAPIAALVPLLLASAALAASPGSMKKAADPTPELPPATATQVWEPVPPVVNAPAGGAPSDAVVLFDGSSLDAWESAKTPGAPAPWRIEGDAMVCVPTSGPLRTKAAFGDLQLHLEFRTPTPVSGQGQGRGNSGVFLMGIYELQILDSYENPTYVNGQAAAIYKQYPPLVRVADLRRRLDRAPLRPGRQSRQPGADDGVPQRCPGAARRCAQGPHAEPWSTRLQGPRRPPPARPAGPQQRDRLPHHLGAGAQGTGRKVTGRQTDDPYR